VLVGASAVSTALITGGITAPSAEASDTLPWPGDRAAGTNQPSQRGYTPDQVLAWDPSTDPDAELLRARVPLQERATPASGARRPGRGVVPRLVRVRCDQSPAPRLHGRGAPQRRALARHDLLLR